MEKKDTGFLGEERAAQVLLEKGYTILERNWFCKKQEIDIIATKDNSLVFVEVKTRSTRENGDPAECVTRKQRNGIIKAANYYLMEKNTEYAEIRFDIFSVFVYSGGMEIDHIEEAFYPLTNEIKV